MKHLIEKINQKLNAQGGFLKAVSLLVGGTAFAQLLSIIFLPILTRIYSPQDFSIFAMYTSILAILSVVSCFRFEIAIPIPSDQQEAVSLTIVAFLSNFLFSVCLCGGIYSFNDELVSIFNKPELKDFLWLLPIGVFFSGLYTIFQYWATRSKQFSSIAKTTILQSGSGIAVQLTMGFLEFGVLGLIIGQIFKQSAGFINLFRSYLKEAFQFFKNENITTISNTIKKNSQFPKYSIWDALANTASIHLPIIFMGGILAGAEIGYLMLAMQLLTIPLGFIGKAVSQVYLSEAPIQIENKKIGEYTLQTLDNLLVFGVSLLIVIGILSPALVKYVFGPNWGPMGVMITWMTPWFIFQLLSSPISMIMHITGKQKQLLGLTLFGLCLKSCILYGTYILLPTFLIESFALSSALFYIVCLIIFTKTAQVTIIEGANILKERILLLFGITCIALTISWTLQYLGI